MGLPLGGASDLIGAGLWMASHPGDGDGVQCPVQRAVATAVEAMPRALAATCFQGRDASQRCERCLVTDPTVVGPADQQLRGHDWADPGLGKKRRPCRMLLDQLEQLGVEFGELRRQEPDPRRDGLQTEHRQALLDRCCGREL